MWWSNGGRRGPKKCQAGKKNTLFENGIYQRFGTGGRRLTLVLFFQMVCCCSISIGRGLRAKELGFKTAGLARIVGRHQPPPTWYRNQRTFTVLLSSWLPWKKKNYFGLKNPDGGDPKGKRGRVLIFLYLEDFFKKMKGPFFAQFWVPPPPPNPFKNFFVF